MQKRLKKLLDIAKFIRDHMYDQAENQAEKEYFCDGKQSSTEDHLPPFYYDLCKAIKRFK